MTRKWKCFLNRLTNVDNTNHTLIAPQKMPNSTIPKEIMLSCTKPKLAKMIP